MLQSFSISSFKQLSSFQLENLSRFTIFLGESNAGKTSALQSLMFYFAKDNKERFINETFNGNLNSLFPYLKPTDITLQANFSNNITEKEQYLFESENLSLKNPHADLISLPFSAYDPGTILPDSLWKECFLTLEKRGSKKLLVKLLKSIESELVDVFVRDDQLYTKTSHLTLPFDYAGTGMKRLFTLIYLVTSQKHTPCFMDLVEKGFHPLYVRAMPEFLHYFSVQYNRQFFISCHTTDLINGFLRFLPDSDDLTVVLMENGKPTIYKGEEIESLVYPYKSF